jgi:hypothetical protein
LYKAEYRQNSWVRTIYFGSPYDKTYLKSHKDKVKKDWYDSHKYAIDQQLGIGNFFAPVILEWKILYNQKTLRKSILDYLAFLSSWILFLFYWLMSGQ